jgi:hypothetical protein
METDFDMGWVDLVSCTMQNLAVRRVSVWVPFKVKRCGREGQSADGNREVASRRPRIVDPMNHCEFVALDRTVAVAGGWREWSSRVSLSIGRATGCDRDGPPERCSDRWFWLGLFGDPHALTPTGITIGAIQRLQKCAFAFMTLRIHTALHPATLFVALSLQFVSRCPVRRE